MYVENRLHFLLKQGKFSKQECPLDIFLPFKNLYIASSSVLSVCLLFHPSLAQATFFWWITLNEVFLRRLCLAEVDNPHSVSSLLILLHNVFLAYNINRISTACKKDFDVMLDTNRQTLYFNLISSLESVTACWVYGRLGLF